ncbi:MAG: hypothetical protein CMP25_03210 [Rickettsiales bacterium]|nr:hypothetical protein [Rickettsiales bacterium]|tara:strand:- start:1413 stop:1688 length:276 start_codon:yes stop_codon:yes gene_type:complete
MPEIKIIIDNEKYSLECEEGEEEELKKAADIVNDKMNIFEDEINISRSKKLLMVSLLLASESNEALSKLNDQQDKTKKIESLLDELEKFLD